MACLDAEEIAFLEAQLVLCEAAITATWAAITAVTVGGVASYSLDTGQTRQTVTKSNVGSIRLQLNELYMLRDMLRTRLCGGSYYVRPGF
jgi:hypothetical protein